MTYAEKYLGNSLAIVNFIVKNQFLKKYQNKDGFGMMKIYGVLNVIIKFIYDYRKGNRLKIK